MAVPQNTAIQDEQLKPGAFFVLLRSLNTAPGIAPMSADDKVKWAYTPIGLSMNLQHPKRHSYCTIPWAQDNSGNYVRHRPKPRRIPLFRNASLKSESGQITDKAINIPVIARDRVLSQAHSFRFKL